MSSAIFCILMCGRRHRLLSSPVSFSGILSGGLMSPLSLSFWPIASLFPRCIITGCLRLFLWRLPFLRLLYRQRIWPLGTIRFLFLLRLAVLTGRLWIISVCCGLIVVLVAFSLAGLLDLCSELASLVPESGLSCLGRHRLHDHDAPRDIYQRNSLDRTHYSPDVRLLRRHDIAMRVYAILLRVDYGREALHSAEWLREVVGMVTASSSFENLCNLNCIPHSRLSPLVVQVPHTALCDHWSQLSDKKVLWRIRA